MDKEALHAAAHGVAELDTNWATELHATGVPVQLHGINSSD